MVIKACYKKLLLAVLVCVLVALHDAPHAFASTYGQANYGDCAYQVCAVTPPVVMPSGLEVSITLANNQAIPFKGYKIFVAPVYGQSSSFEKVDFYVNGALVQTVFPDNTGVATWLWKPQKTGTTNMRIVITGKADGDTVTKEYTLNVEDDAESQSSTPAASAWQGKGGSSGLTEFLQNISDSLTRSINALPAPVVYSFPYFLLALLGINALLLLWQQRRELQEYHRLQKLIVQARALNDTKKTFIELAAHYLRTPLTVIRGGVDLMQKQDLVISSIDLHEVADRMRNKIEALIDKVNAAVAVVNATQGLSAGSKKPWRQPALFLPVVLIGFIGLAFNYLVAQADKFNVTQVNLVSQVIIFTIFVVAMYQIFRQLELRKRQKNDAQKIMNEVAAINHARDELISSTVAALQNDITELDRATSQFAPSPATKFMREGQSRFADMLSKFTVATRLQGSQSQREFEAVTLSVLFNNSLKDIKSEAESKNISIELAGDTTIKIQDFELVSFVLKSLLDNAIAYSHEGGKVSVGTSAVDGKEVITVTDHGTGILAEKAAMLFQPFTRAEGAENFTHQGMGFSLYLDKLIMTYLGGDIDLRSEPNSGTKVTLHLPKSTSRLK